MAVLPCFSLHLHSCKIDKCHIPSAQFEDFEKNCYDSTFGWRYPRTWAEAGGEAMEVLLVVVLVLKLVAHTKNLE
jgi:hypothetical protein